MGEVSKRKDDSMVERGYRGACRGCEGGGMLLHFFFVKRRKVKLVVGSRECYFGCTGQ